jgi:superfamily II DNA/RNA helicase
VWDVVIVDEAHHATVASQRYDAVNTLAQRARHVILVTATPHGGDDREYRALCSLGAIANDEPVLLFRRTRELVGMPRRRRVHLLPVGATPETSCMHSLLDAYLAQLWTLARASGKRDVQLLALVLAKRAFSSAHSLQLSLERRLAALNGEIDAPSAGLLPFDADDEVSDEAPMPSAPAFVHVEEEREIIRRLIDSARRACGHEGKLRALRRIVRRVRERLIIFTEYRDTLDAIGNAIGGMRPMATLHGGQTSHERRESLNAFRSGSADVLLATDAGSEGLNLQDCCRVVINLELPWSPIRLEQRIGRVDRIGQMSTVHAINLLADGTAERTVLARLLRRIDRIRLSEIDIAASVIGRSEPPPRPMAIETSTGTVDLGAAALTETIRLRGARQRSAHLRRVPAGVVPVCLDQAAAAALIAFFRVRLVTDAGRMLEDRLIPIRIPFASRCRRTKRRDVRALAESLFDAVGSELLRHARIAAEERSDEIERESARSVERSVSRERTVTARAARRAAYVQASLFDRRALRQKWTADEIEHSLRRESEARTALLRASVRVLSTDAELVMLFIQCSRA